MRIAMRCMAFWPGLPQLWLRGDWRGLAAALTFSALLNSGIAASFLWPGRLPAAAVVTIWAATAGFWCWTLWRTQADADQIAPIAGGPAVEALFRSAQAQYLQGQWSDAEATLQRILRRQADDAEARLLLAAVFRRRQRWDDAVACLLELQQWDGAKRWRNEIQNELEEIEHARRPGVAESQSIAEPGSDPIRNASPPSETNASQTGQR